MKALLSILIIFASCTASSKDISYQGSTTANLTIRKFLNISLTDSIDFIRWTLTLDNNNYALDCRYGLSKANTNGFTNEKQAAFKGTVLKQGNYFVLQQQNRLLNILQVNTNILHLLNENRQFLTGNGGYSCALNNTKPVKTSAFNYTSKETAPLHLMAFQGRTPCREISAVMGMQASADCIKKKWYVLLYADATGKPAYFLQGGIQHRRETMDKGQWEIMHQNGRIIYKLTTQKSPNPIYLLKADDTILFFTDAQGNLLPGNEDFSYTLNRTEDREPK